jgi:hypothetical protein
MHPKEPQLGGHGRPSLVQILTEATMIVFSILLALSVESCRERHKQQELADLALRAIRAEIVSNRKAIDGSLPLQRSQAKALQGIASATSPQPLRITSGMAPPSLTRSAFETATMTGALSGADLETVMAISHAYSYHSWMTRSEDAWLRVVLSSDSWIPDTSGRTAGLLLGVLNEYIRLETRLEAAYDDVLTRLPENGAR